MIKERQRRPGLETRCQTTSSVHASLHRPRSQKTASEKRTASPTDGQYRKRIDSKLSATRHDGCLALSASRWREFISSYPFNRCRQSKGRSTRRHGRARQQSRTRWHSCSLADPILHEPYGRLRSRCSSVRPADLRVSVRQKDASPAPDVKVRGLGSRQPPGR